MTIFWLILVLNLIIGILSIRSAIKTGGSLLSICAFMLSIVNICACLIRLKELL